MTQLFANNARSRLNASLSIGGTSLTLLTSGGAAFPSPTGGDFFLITLYEYGGGGEQSHEVCKVTARSGDTLTIERAQEGTTARAWEPPTPVELRVTRDTLYTFVAEGDSIGATTPSTGTFTALTANDSATLKHTNSTKLATTSTGVSVTGNITVSGTVDGRDIAADGTKLNGIEDNATADQTAAEIKTLYESNAETNALTDAEKTKLAGLNQGVGTGDNPTFNSVTSTTGDYDSTTGAISFPTAGINNSVPAWGSTATSETLDMASASVFRRNITTASATFTLDISGIPAGTVVFKTLILSGGPTLAFNVGTSTAYWESGTPLTTLPAGRTVISLLVTGGVDEIYFFINGTGFA